MVIAGISLVLIKACSADRCAFESAAAEDCSIDECPCTTIDFRTGSDYCVRLIGCRSDAECPAGTVCLSEEKNALEGEYSACELKQASLTSKTRCKLAKDRNPAALIMGFGVNEFLMERIEGSQGFRFVPPPNTWYVACALFGCTPNVQPITCGLDDQPVGRIVNYERCSLSGEPQISSLVDRQEGDETPFVFTAKLSLPSLRGDRTCESKNVLKALDGDVIAHVSAACWAYDDKSVIGATRLVPLEEDQLAELSDVISADCLGGISSMIGRTCVLSKADAASAALPELGSCYQQECRPRCITASDCPVRPPSPDCEQPVATCTHAPDSDEATIDSYVGVCIYSCDREEIVDAGLGYGGGQP